MASFSQPDADAPSYTTICSALTDTSILHVVIQRVDLDCAWVILASLNKRYGEFILIENRYVDIDFLATYFKVSPQTIRRWSKTPEFPSPFRIGAGTLRWRLEDIENLEQALCGDVSAQCD